MHTGYVICNIDRAAAASSPHMISLTTISPDISSDRRIGRPTMEGNWCSGKFCVQPTPVSLSPDRTIFRCCTCAA